MKVFSKSLQKFFRQGFQKCRFYSQNIRIETFPFSEFGTNLYLVSREGNDELVVIDTPMQSFSGLRDSDEFTDRSLIHFFYTHGHYDHSNDSALFQEAYPDNSRFYIHEGDFHLVETTIEFNHHGDKTIKFDHYYEDMEEIEVLGTTLQVIHTPGHTKGGCCLYFKEYDQLFTGDTLFLGSIGRTDFVDSSWDDMVDSLQNKIYKLPDDVVCFPGHGPQTQVGREKKQNPFVRENDVTVI